MNRLPFEMKPPKATQRRDPLLRWLGRVLAVVFWAVLIFTAMAVGGLWLMQSR